jgi:hypothetical protein
MRYSQMVFLSVVLMIAIVATIQLTATTYYPTPPRLFTPNQTTPGKASGATWRDPSTGEFYVQCNNDQNSWCARTNGSGTSVDVNDIWGDVGGGWFEIEQTN